MILKNNYDASFTEFALAWNHKKITPKVDSFTKTTDANCPNNISWGFNEYNSTDYKFRLQISTDEEQNNMIKDIFILGDRYCFDEANDEENYFYTIKTYPLDSNVAHEYPSAKSIIN